ncbi:MAG: hypothetical protein GYA21_08340 [Myxococcales bacterium]|nr:hypothetical protein [Myxococcales bacterium]
MPNEPPESSSWGFERIVPDGIKRAVLAGVGTLFMSEEGIRSVLGDLKLPKEVAQFILNQAAKTKDELFRALAHEVREFLESARLSEELKRLLSETAVEIRTTVRFVPSGESFKPRTRTRVKVHSHKGSRKSEAEDGGDTAEETPTDSPADRFQGTDGKGA